MLRIEQESGKILIFTSSGEKQFQARGYVDFGILVNAISKLDLGEKRTSRIQKIITSGGDQVWSLLETGGAITQGGRIIALGEGNRQFLEAFFKSIPEKVITKAWGARVESIAHLTNKNDLYLNPNEKVLILRENAGSELVYENYGKSYCSLKFLKTGDDKDDCEGLLNACTLIEAITKRFTRLYSQTGISSKGMVSPGTLSRQLLLNIADKSGRSILKKW